MSDGMYEQAMQIVRKQFDLLDQDGDIAVSPSIVAAKAYEEIDPGTISPVLVQYTSILELRQLAREVCRKKYEDGDTELDKPQGEMFDGQLQGKYPVTRNEERVYVPRGQMTEQDYAYNVKRLRTEAVAKARHADALEAEMQERKNLGHFDDVAVA